MRAGLHLLSASRWEQQLPLPLCLLYNFSRDVCLHVLAQALRRILGAMQRPMSAPGVAPSPHQCAVCAAQLYGPIRAAPQLTGADPGDDNAHWSSQAATSQQLAACLATPFTGQDQNLGEIVRGEVNRLTADQELKTQLRWVLT